MLRLTQQQILQRTAVNMYIGPWQEMKLAQRIAADRKDESKSEANLLRHPPEYVTIGPRQRRCSQRRPSLSAEPNHSWQNKKHSSFWSTRSGASDISSWRSGFSRASDPGPHCTNNSIHKHTKLKNRPISLKSEILDVDGDYSRPYASTRWLERKKYQPFADGQKMLGENPHPHYQYTKQPKQGIFQQWDDRESHFVWASSESSLSSGSFVSPLKRDMQNKRQSLRGFCADISALRKVYARKEEIQTGTSCEGIHSQRRSHKSPDDRIKRMKEIYVGGGQSKHPEPLMDKHNKKNHAIYNDTADYENDYVYSEDEIHRNIMKKLDLLCSNQNYSDETSILQGNKDHAISRIRDKPHPTFDRNTSGSDLCHRGKFIMKQMKSHNNQEGKKNTCSTNAIPLAPHHSQFALSLGQDSLLNSNRNSGPKSSHSDSLIPVDDLLEWADSLVIDIS